MFDLIVFTDRLLCRGDFFVRIEKLAKAHPRAIVLREKDLSEDAYRELAKKVIGICSQYGTLCILHNFVSVAKGLGHDALHLPLHVLCALTAEERAGFKILGASCHSSEDAWRAERLGCTYITAGHIFDTDCKKGLPGRGIAFLEEICENVSIPVYAIGGVDPENIRELEKAGVMGACVMSGAMVCRDVSAYLAGLDGIDDKKGGDRSNDKDRRL